MIVDRGHLGTRMGKSCHVHMFCWLILVVVIASSQVTRLIHELPSPLHVAKCTARCTHQSLVHGRALRGQMEKPRSANDSRREFDQLS